MKIYFIGQKGIPVVEGGVESHVENLAIRLVECGHKVYVYTKYNYSDKQRKKYKGVNLINLPSISRKNLDAISHTFLATIHLLLQKADIIHYHSIGPSSLLWLVKLFKRKTPIIATFHSQCYLHQKWSAFARAYLKFGEFILCKLADSIIVPSKVLQHYVAKRYQRQPIYIPNGVTLPERSKELKELKKFGLESKEYILTVGRLVRDKNIHLIIEAYKKVNTSKKLVVVGQGAYTDDYVQELIKRVDNNPNIIFLGNQSGTALKALFANAHLFVQASELEGLSIALLEAMSYGIPVLVSDIEENLEAIEDAGWAFRQGSIIDLRHQLSNMLRSPAVIKRMGAKARERVSCYYNWNNLIKDVLKIYNDSIDYKEGGKYQFHSRRITKDYNILD